LHVKEISGFHRTGFDNEGKRDWSVGTNRRVRQVRDRFTKGANNDKILILSISPLVLAWRATYAGDDKDALNYSNGGDSGCGSSRESEREQPQAEFDSVNQFPYYLGQDLMLAHQGKSL
jgi:hypothetical protein